MATVLKPFKSLNRKFKTNDAVVPSDIEGAVTFDIWVERGFISGDASGEAKTEGLGVLDPFATEDPVVKSKKNDSRR